MYEQEVGSCEDLCEGDMKSMQNSIYGSFWNESSGGVGGGLESLLDKAGDQEEQKPSVLCGSSGAAASSSHEPQEKVVETPKKGQRTGTPKPVVATPKATPGAGLVSRLSPKTQGTCKSPPQGDDGAAGAKKRGRAPKDHEVIVRQEVQEFLKADATTSLWWGADAKTGSYSEAQRNHGADLQVPLSGSRCQAQQMHQSPQLHDGPSRSCAPARLGEHRVQEDLRPSGQSLEIAPNHRAP